MSDTMYSITTVELDRWSAAVAARRFGAEDSDSELLALVESAERVKDACAALQARATHEYSDRRLAALAVGSAPDQDTRRDIAARIARARHVSPTHGSRYLELSRMLVRDLPRTLDALATGRTSEYRASLVAHAAACLGTADRAALDADLGPRLSGKGNRSVQGEADRIAAELDAEAVVERHRQAEKDRRVTLRPAPDTMTYLTALLPVADGVAAWAALDRHATLAKAAGDRRSRGQLMADELAHRLLRGTASEVRVAGPTQPAAPTGSPGPLARPTPCRVPAERSGSHFVTPPRSPDSGAGTEWSDHRDGSTCERDAASGQPGCAEWPSCESPTGDVTDRRGVPPNTSTSPAVPPVRQIDLMLVMTDRALLDGADTAAVIPGYGPVPAALARGMLADADPATRIFLRRLYTDPTGEQLLTADARGRLFPHAVRQFVLARDHRCRTPFCDAPIRHIDHTVPYSAGGPSSLDNNGGLCERCSLSKAARTDTAVQPGPAPRPPRSEPWGSTSGIGGSRTVPS